MVEEKLWSQLILTSQASIGRAIEVLNEASLKFLMVVNESNVLIGTISDGDIRRGLLKGLEFSSSIEHIVHYHPIFVNSELRKELVIELMKTNNIKFIPIVDINNRVLGLHSWDALHSHTLRSNIMVIMAGGKGTRLRPLTKSCPKPLLLVQGRPILEHIIIRARAEGFSQFVVALNYLGHLIEEYFGSGEKFGVKIQYIKEDTPLGTAGALSLLKYKPDAPFVVTNGDVLTDIRYSKLLDFHINQNAFATMAVRQYESQNPFGVVMTEGVEIMGYEEKPKSYCQINAGVYVLHPQVLNLLEPNTAYDMPELIQITKSCLGRTVAYSMQEDWIDVGTVNDLKKANDEIQSI
jgi:dTDP-glucose pyrophosphorylase/predicted transcriptional regulator